MFCWCFHVSCLYCLECLRFEVRADPLNRWNGNNHGEIAVECPILWWEKFSRIPFWARVLVQCWVAYANKKVSLIGRLLLNLCEEFVAFFSSVNIMLNLIFFCPVFSWTSAAPLANMKLWFRSTFTAGHEEAISHRR